MLFFPISLTFWNSFSYIGFDEILTICSGKTFAISVGFDFRVLLFTVQVVDPVISVFCNLYKNKGKKDNILNHKTFFYLSPGTSVVDTVFLVKEQ